MPFYLRDPMVGSMRTFVTDRLTDKLTDRQTGLDLKDQSVGPTKYTTLRRKCFITNEMFNMFIPANYVT